jgi:hypothetical protein
MAREYQVDGRGPGPQLVVRLNPADEVGNEDARIILPERPVGMEGVRGHNGRPFRGVHRYTLRRNGMARGKVQGDPSIPPGNFFLFSLQGTCERTFGLVVDLLLPPSF